MPKRTLLLSVAGLLLLGACASPAGHDKTAAGDKKVATLASAGATPAGTSSTSDADSRRPRIRLDTSDDEHDRLYIAYDDCLVAHGVKVLTGKPGEPQMGISDTVGRPSKLLDHSGEPKSAYTACLSKKPVEPPELDESTNPNYAAQWNDNVKCLRAHGDMVHVVKPGEWTYDSSNTVTPPNEAELEKTCLIQAFGGHESSK
jgi:hypothetical protein